MDAQRKAVSYTPQCGRFQPKLQAFALLVTGDWRFQISATETAMAAEAEEIVVIKRPAIGFVYVDSCHA
jgi:hypothetical protein